MKAALSLYLPRWQTDRLRRRLHLDSRTAVLLTAIDHQREIIAACCGRAESAGVSPGMTLAHARSLLRDNVHVEELDERRSAHHLKRFAAWCLRFTPVVAVDPPDGVLLDATGCERLYGGMKPLILRILNTVRRQRFAARIGLAPTWRAAWAAARFGQHDVTVIRSEGLQATLSELPVASLDVDLDALEAMQAVGLATIGQLLAMPRSAIASRYGQDVLLRLDQALGSGVELITPVCLAEPVCAERVLEGPTDRLDSVEAVACELVADVVGQLASRESGARWLVLTLARSDLEDLRIPIRLASPTRDAAHLWALLRHRLETAHLGFGVEGVQLEALSLCKIPHRQQEHWKVPSRQEDVSRFVDLARGRGLVVEQPAPCASYWPERVNQWVEIGARSPGFTLMPQQVDRPTLLLTRPRSMKATLLLPDGPLMAVQFDDASRRVLTCIGPERIEPEWWRPQQPARDYFKVQTEEGRWLWIFREGTGGWFLHGLWA